MSNDCKLSDKIVSEPCVGTPVENGVKIDGPDQMSLTMTPEAAIETARSISDAAVDKLIEQAAGATRTDR